MFSSAVQQVLKAHENEVASLREEIRKLGSKLTRADSSELELVGCLESHAHPCQDTLIGGVTHARRHKPRTPRLAAARSFPRTPTLSQDLASKIDRLPRTPNISIDLGAGDSTRAVVSRTSKKSALTRYSSAGDSSENMGVKSVNTIHSLIQNQEELNDRVEEWMMKQESYFQEQKSVIQNFVEQQVVQRQARRTKFAKDMTTVAIDSHAELDYRLKSQAIEEGMKAMKSTNVIVADSSGPDFLKCLLCTNMLQMVGSLHFELFFTCAIICSSILLGWKVQYSATHLVYQAPVAIEVVDCTFAFLFLAELALRVLANGSRIFWSHDAWLWHWLDLAVVASSLFEVAMFMASDSAAGVDGWRGALLTTCRAARVLRVTRMVRVFRLARVANLVRALRTLVSSIAHTFKPLAWAMALLSLIIYVFGIIFTQAYVDYSIQNSEDANVKLKKYWGSLWDTMLTLFQAISGGLSWEVATNEIERVSVVYVLFFVIYIIIALFTVLNVMTAVFCQSAIESAQRDTEMMIQLQLQNKESYCEQVRQLFKHMDDDQSGTITIQEFELHMDKASVKALFDTMELQVDDAWILFKLLDSDGSGWLDIDEFVEGCCRLRGSASRVDIAKLNSESKYICEAIATLTKLVEITLLVDSSLTIRDSAKGSDSLGRRRRPNGSSQGSTKRPSKEEEIVSRLHSSATASS